MIEPISECLWEAHMIDVGEIRVKHLAVLDLARGEYMGSYSSLSVYPSIYHPSIYRSIPLLPLLPPLLL